MQAKKKITFTVNDKPYTATTNNNGAATVKLDKKQKEPTVSPLNFQMTTLIKQPVKLQNQQYNKEIRVFHQKYEKSSQRTSKINPSFILKIKRNKFL